MYCILFSHCFVLYYCVVVVAAAAVVDESLFKPCLQFTVTINSLSTVLTNYQVPLRLAPVSKGFVLNGGLDRPTIASNYRNVYRYERSN